MNKIKLNNRDHADLWLEQINNTDWWQLKVDKKHEYCLKYMRMGGDFEIEKTPENSQYIKWTKVVMMDPSGGPYLEVGDILDNKYKIVEMNADLQLKLSEEHNN